MAGEQPSNQQLLDWLAVDFREHGWDVKRIFKLMVMSATYRQSAVTTHRKKLEKDPENRLLLARGPRFPHGCRNDSRLRPGGQRPAREENRGTQRAAVSATGDLGDTVGMPAGDTRIYKQDTGDNLYRRSLYTFWKRQSRAGFPEIFNAPSREVCTVRRDRTNTPLQALVTLNDPQFVEAAVHLAQESLENKTLPVWISWRNDCSRGN